MSDNVKHPAHYSGAGIECIDVIKLVLGEGMLFRFLLRELHQVYLPLETEKRQGRSGKGPCLLRMDGRNELYAQRDGFDKRNWKNPRKSRKGV